MPRDSAERQTNPSTEKHIPRPANCFMIFRADWLRNSAQGAQRQKDVSLDAAMAWKTLSPPLKQLYKIQADIIKEEHRKKYPGWVYQPKRKVRPVHDDSPEGPPPKRVARGQTAAPHEKPLAKVKGGREAKATQTVASKEPVWNGSWFSASSPMKDPFYSAPLQSLASGSSMAPPPTLSTTPRPFPPPAQMYGFGTTPNFHTTPPMYHHDGELRNLERHDHNASTPANNALDLASLRTSSQETTQPEPPAVSGASIHPSNSTGKPSPTSTDEAPAPGSEVQPPTQSLVGISDLAYNRIFESYCNHDSWVSDPISTLDFDSWRGYN